MARASTAGLRSEGWPHLLVLALLVHAAFALVLALHLSGVLPHLERLVYGTYLRQLSPAADTDPNVVVVEYTAPDEARYGYPLPDRTLAELLERLLEARPIAIGLDLIRDRPEPASGDAEGQRRLAAALTAHESVIGIVKETEPGFGPPPALADRPVQLAFVDIVRDPDGLVRRGLLYLTTPAATRPSLALQLAARRLMAEGVTPAWEGDRLRLGATEYVRLRPQSSSLYASAERALDDGGYQFLLTFPVCPLGYARLSVGEVLDRQPDPAALEGRIVLIGNTVELVKDKFDVPVDCQAQAPGEMFGVHLHAQMVSQLIRQADGGAHPIETLGQRFGSAPLGAAAGLGWTWLWCLLGGGAALLVGSSLRLAAVTGGEAALVVGASVGAFVALGLWIPVVAPLLGAAGAATLTGAYLMVRARGEREQLMRLFAASVSDRVARTIWKTRATLAGPGRPPPRLMMASVLFSDIRKFSTISTMLPESRLATWLNLYMEAMVDIVEEQGGVIEKFAGDGLTVEFGVPEPRETDAEVAADAQAAVDCALAMAARLDQLNRAMVERDLPQIAIRVGIHSGPLMAGMIGGAKRWQFSVIGDTANTAARLESYGKDDARLGCEEDHCRILISEATYHLLEGRYAALPVGELEMRNRGPIAVYLVTGVRGRS